MPPKFKSPLREQPLLISPNLLDWVPQNHIVWFYINAVKKLDLSIDEFYINKRGNGKPQYDPYMMLTLLIYCSSRGIRSSRKIEYATYDNVAVRVITGDMHPDHDTINEFRRKNKLVLEKAFVSILHLAEHCHLTKLGDISLNSTQIKANASKQKSHRIEPFIEKEAYYQSIVDKIMTQMDGSENEANPDIMPPGMTDFFNAEKTQSVSVDLGYTSTADKNTST